MINDTTYVYVMGAKNSETSPFYKIGISSYLEKRAVEVSVALAMELDVKHYVAFDSRDKAFTIEQTAHSILKDKSIGNECFTVTSEEAIDAIGKAIAVTPENETKKAWRKKMGREQNPPMALRFNRGIRKAVTEAARKKGLTVTDFTEQLYRQELDRMGIEVTKDDE